MSEPRLILWGGRADNGGLAALTAEFARHMQPERTVVMDLGPLGRGPTRPDRYDLPGVHIHHGMDNFTDAEIAHRLDGMDVAWLVEVPYASNFFDVARRMGVATVGVAMPELRTLAFAPDVLINPTTYLLDRMASATVLPVPVALDHHPPRLVSEVRRLFVLAAPAFHNREGTESVIEALPHVTEPCTVVFRQVGMGDAHRRHLPATVGCVTVEMDTRDVADHWHTIPDDVDAHVVLRRFGGLSLPMQEAAARGLPIITSDLVPQNQWVPRPALVPSAGRSQINTAGGWIDVHSFDARDIARRIDALVGGEHVATQSAQVRSWAEANSWERLLPAYRQVVERAAKMVRR